jgi:hypothetical protein
MNRTIVRSDTANATAAPAVSSGIARRKGLRPNRSEAAPTPAAITADATATTRNRNPRRSAEKPITAR